MVAVVGALTSGVVITVKDFSLVVVEDTSAVTGSLADVVAVADPTDVVVFPAITAVQTTLWGIKTHQFLAIT